MAVYRQLFAFSAFALFIAGSVAAQTFPNRPLRIVVPYPPGDSPDVLARTLGPKVSENFGARQLTR